MTPEQAAEEAAASLKTAGAWANDREAVTGFVQIADAWTRLHTALAHAPKQIEPATPDEHYEFGIDRLMRRNEELKQAAASKPTEPRPDVIKLSNDANRLSVIRLHGTDYEIHGCAFRDLSDVHATVELQLVRKP